MEKTIKETIELKKISVSEGNTWLNNRQIFDLSKECIDNAMFSRILSEFETLDEEILSLVLMKKYQI